MSLVSDDEDAGGCFDDIVGDGLELVDVEHASDLKINELHTITNDVIEAAQSTLVIGVT